MSSGGNL